MIDFIKKTIHPPGINKPNRLALFTAIGEVAGKVRTDALAAFNAHFPYLADSVKLEEHGKALIIPHLAEDTEREFRDRVSTASFFLMRAGERAYIREQLQAHFGDRYILKEDFLKVYVQIVDLAEDDRSWVTGFLDWILNPAVALTVAEWFNLVDEIFMEDADTCALYRSTTDFLYQGLRCDGRFLCDQGRAALCDGSLISDGSWHCVDFHAAPGTIYDTVAEPLYPNGAYKCDGSFDCSGAIRLDAPLDITGPIFPADEGEDRLIIAMGLEAMEDAARIAPVCDGAWVCDGSNLAPIADALMPIRIIRPLRCDGARAPSCTTCDGTWMCDGKHTGFDGWYCSGDVIHEEAA